MKTFEQFIKEVEKGKPKEKLKEYIRNEYKCCIDTANRSSERLENSIKDFIKGSDKYISFYSMITQHKEIELSNHIAKLYEDLFGEKIDE